MYECLVLIIFVHFMECKLIYKTDKVKDKVKNVIYILNLEEDNGLQLKY